MKKLIQNLGNSVLSRTEMKQVKGGLEELGEIPVCKSGCGCKNWPAVVGCHCTNVGTFGRETQGKSC